MALATRELFSDNDQGAGLRAKAREDGVKVGTFANVALGPTLAKLTPLAFNTSTKKWVAWTTGGANGTGVIGGFAWPDAVVLDATGEVQGQILVNGVVHLDDIAVPSGETLANLKTAIKSPTTRSVRLDIQGLADIQPAGPSA